MYPRMYSGACQAVTVMKKLCKNGPIDMSDMSLRIAAGKLAMQCP